MTTPAADTEGENVWAPFPTRRVIALPLDFPQIYVLCGSTRFVDAFNHWRKVLTQNGHIVLSIEIVTTQQRNEDPQHVNRQNKEMLDDLHKRKIDLADQVMVLNVGGYIGESTLGEIRYAMSHGKHTQYLEPPGHMYLCDECLPTIGTSAEGMAHK